MAGSPPPYAPDGSSYGPPDPRVLKYQRRMMRDQARAQARIQRDQIRFQLRGMRRGSLLGPVLLVVLGVVFLLVETGRIPFGSVWEWYGRWWPLLLVGAGAVLLAEWAIDRALPRPAGQPYIRRGAGGVVTLILLLALGGAALRGVHNIPELADHGFSINPDNLAQFLGSRHESDQTLDEALPAGTSLTLDNPHGDVTITGVSTDGRVHVAIHKQVYSNSDSDAEAKARQLTPEVGSTLHGLSLRMPAQGGATADLTVTVPYSANLIVNANHGDVHIEGQRAPVTVTANHGDIVLTSIAAAVMAHLNNSGSSFSAHQITGPLTLEGRADDLTLSDIAGAVNLTGDFYGTIHFERIAAPLRFHTSRTDLQLARLDGEIEIGSEEITATQLAGPIILTTRDRNIQLDRASGEVSVSNRNGTVELTSAPPLGNINIQNRRGSVTMTLPDRSAFVINAETTDGSIENDFSLPNVDHEEKATMSGTVGKEGPLLRITTSQGDVAVRKASIAPLAPAAPPIPPAPPQVSIRGDDGSSVYVGKDGLRIHSGDDGSSVIVGKDGLKITSGSDGSSVFKNKQGTDLVDGADGARSLSERNGFRYAEAADSGKNYKGRDGTTIVVRPDGRRTAKSARGEDLNENEIQRRLRQAQDEVRVVERERDAERNRHRSFE